MSGIYIHIPFCASRCTYCDFYSTTIRGRKEQYVEAICKEADERREFFTAAGEATTSQSASKIKTIYFGGGTPSQLGLGNIEKIIDHLRNTFDCRDVEEITIEVNPEDIHCRDEVSLFSVGEQDLQERRISMGVQSMVDEELTLINRRHNAQRVREAVKTIRQAGCHNLSLDLMYGLPGQSLESLRYSIDQLLELAPEHISAYNLTIEEGTRIATMIRKGEITVADDDMCLEMAAIVRTKLKEAGYEHYEISNYCKPGFQSRHNTSYWDTDIETGKGIPYLGLGPGAHSYDGDRKRSWNLPYVLEYLKGNRQEDYEILTDTDMYNERIMLGLRTAKGAIIDGKRRVLTEEELAIADTIIKSYMI